jgi:O-antigen/teichoic acid export membrane protein
MNVVNSLIAKLNNKYILSLAGNIIMSGVGMAITIILLRALTLNEMGVWILFFTILSLGDTFRSGFLTIGFIKFYSGADKARAADVVGSMWFLATAITLLFLLLNIPAYFISDNVSNAGVALFLKWFGVTYIVSLPYFVSTCVLQARQRFDQLLVIKLFNQGLFAAFLLIFVILRDINIYTVLYSYILSNAVASIIALIMGWTLIKKIRYTSRKTCLELIDFGKFSVGTTISANLFGTADKFIINFMLGPAALAVYDTGTRLIQVVEIPLRSFIATAMPSLSTFYNQGLKTEVLIVMKKYIGLITLAFIPAAMFTFVFADYIILLLGGIKYVTSEAPNILRIFMVVALLFPVDRFLALTLDVIHQPKINFVKVIVMLVVTIATDFLGIYLTGGVYGVALATVFPVLAGICISFYALNKYYERFLFIDIYLLGIKELKLMIQSFTGKKQLVGK